MHMEYPYSYTITMRRSREEIIRGSRFVEDPTLRRYEEKNAKRLINRICKLTSQLENNEEIGGRTREKAGRLAYDASCLRHDIYNTTPEWRRIDKSISN